MSEKPKQLPSINGSFTIKGNDAYAVAVLFYEWCKKLEEDMDIKIDNNRVDFNSPRLSP